MSKQPRTFDHWTTYNGHSGIDFPVGVGTPIPASGPGVIVSKSKNDRGGYFTYVQYDCGCKWGYFHLVDHRGPAVGTRVNLGDTVATSGNTGNTTGPHLHVEIYVNGALKAPPAFWDYADKAAGGYVHGKVVLAPNQRQVLPTASANRRGDPSTKNPPIDPALQPNEIGNFDGWIHGEVVNGNGVWFRGISGNWFWSGGFTDTGTHDLADLNTVALQPHQRKAITGLNGRAEPNTTSAVIGGLDAGAVGDFNGWIYGESVEGENRWLRGMHSGAYFSLKFLEPQNTDSLADLNTGPTPEPTPPYTFEAFSPVVTEVKPAAIGNFEDGQGGVRFPLTQDNVVLHDYGTLGTHNYEGTVAWFQNPAAKTSAHFVVSWAHITQMVSLKDRAFHAGKDGNWFVGIEIDPVAGYTGTDATLLARKAATIANVNSLLVELREHYGQKEFVYHKHSEFMQTSCGDDVHFEDYPQGAPDPGPEPQPPVNGVVVPRDVLAHWQEGALWAIGEEIGDYLGG